MEILRSCGSGIGGSGQPFVFGSVGTIKVRGSSVRGFGSGPVSIEPLRSGSIWVASSFVMTSNKVSTSR